MADSGGSPSSAMAIGKALVGESRIRARNEVFSFRCLDFVFGVDACPLRLPRYASDGLVFAFSYGRGSTVARDT